MGACVALIRLVCALVGGSLAALYVTGYTHGRPTLTPQPNNGRPARGPADPFDASTRETCDAAGECASTAPDAVESAPSSPSTTAADGATDDDDEVACRWWTPETGRETDTLCSAFALRRLMGSDALARALERAKQCAILHGTVCVLSHEVELQVPAVMLWDSSTSAMRMYLLPRVVPVAEGELYDERRVAVVRPPFDDDVARSRTPLVVLMNRSVEVDHVSTTSHARESEQLLDDDAYCMQMLQLTIPDRCNEEL
jgi:hypothetical protein